MDGPDLAPATRKRARANAPDPVVELLPPIVTDDLGARLEAVERAIVGLRHDIADGFQEVASRALVLSESTDEAVTRVGATLERIEAVLAALPVPTPAVDLSPIEAAIAALPVPTPAVDLSPIEAAIAALPNAIPKVDLAPVEAAMSALAAGLIPPIEAAHAATNELRIVVAELAERTRANDVRELRSQVELVAERLSTILGGPTLTELMDRIDELDRTREAPRPPPKRRRKEA